MITQNISEKVLKDALSVAGGMYRMNAPYSDGYAFCCNTDNTEVGMGEFMSETIPYDANRLNADNFDGFIHFRDKTLTDFVSGEVVNLEKEKIMN